MATDSKSPLVAVSVAILGLAGGLAYFLVRVDAPMPPVAQPLELAQVEYSDGLSSTPRGPPRQVEARPPSAPAPNTASRMSRDLKREQIWRALDHSPPARRDPAEHTDPLADPPDPADPLALDLPPLATQYIQDAIQEQLVPVAIECYESALEDQPELAGQLLVEFEIVGAEDIGGIVERATINAESTLDSAFVSECMRESVMAVTFEPPPDGGRIAVTYPFNFEPE